MSKYEVMYQALIACIMNEGEERNTRNGKTKALFGTSLKVDLRRGYFPLLQCRKMFYAGVLGELAAFVRKPTHVDDFVRWGCNYWGQWADENGKLSLDYGNAWFEGDQVSRLIHDLQHNPTSRRLMLSSWRPENLDKLSLPCCHHTYQFWVDNRGCLHMLWMQRSVDVFIGLPSDVILAAAMLIAIAKEAHLDPGTITFSMGDTHIYAEHAQAVAKYMHAAKYLKFEDQPTFSYSGVKFVEFEPHMLEIHGYDHGPAIKAPVIA
jgi:thymidylate synthase